MSEDHPVGSQDARPTRTVIVVHRGYGCDTGCCGHAIEVNSEEVSFSFSHPGWKQDFRAFAEELIRNKLGEDHVADLDWDNCEVLDD